MSMTEAGLRLQKFQDAFDGALMKLIEECKIQEDKLTKQQLADALTQALACGDFQKHVVVPESGTQAGQFMVKIRQAVIYLPWHGYEQKITENYRLRELLKKHGIDPNEEIENT